MAKAKGAPSKPQVAFLPLKTFDTLDDFTKYAARHHATPKVGRVIQVFSAVDMRCSHPGLTKYAREHKVDVSKLEPGQYVVFINRARNRLKVYTHGNTFAYKALYGGQRLDLSVICDIPKAFHGTGQIAYDELLKSAVEKALARRSRERVLERAERARAVTS